MLAFGGGKAKSGSEVFGGEGAEGTSAGAGSFVVLVERCFGSAVVGDDFVGDAFE